MVDESCDACRVSEGRHSEGFFKISGTDSETLRPVVVEVKEHLGQSIFIRVVDQHSGPWGHINFDDFKFHKVQPVLANEIKLGKSPAAMPEVDTVMFAGLSPRKQRVLRQFLPGLNCIYSRVNPT